MIAMWPDECWDLFCRIETKYYQLNIKGITKTKNLDKKGINNFPVSKFFILNGDMSATDQMQILNEVYARKLSLSKIASRCDRKKRFNRMMSALCTLAKVTDWQVLEDRYPKILAPELVRRHWQSFKKTGMQWTRSKMPPAFLREVTGVLAGYNKPKNVLTKKNLASLEEDSQSTTVEENVTYISVCGDLGATVIQESCTRRMTKVHADNARLFVLDPPYGVFSGLGWDAHAITEQDFSITVSTCTAMAHASERVTIACFCSSEMVPMITKVMGIHCALVTQLYWSKTNQYCPGTPHGGFTNTMEHIIVGFTGPKQVNKVVLEAGYISWSETELRGNCLTFRPAVSKIKSQGTEGAGGAVNPAQKPLFLLCWLIDHFTEERDVVVDMFAGTGVLLFVIFALFNYLFSVCRVHYCQLVKYFNVCVLRICNLLKLKFIFIF
jgi:hypothetical protein